MKKRGKRILITPFPRQGSDKKVFTTFLKLLEDPGCIFLIDPAFNVFINLWIEIIKTLYKVHYNQSFATCVEWVFPSF